MLNFGIVTQFTLIYYKHLYEQIHRLCSCPQHIFLLWEENEEFFKIALMEIMCPTVYHKDYMINQAFGAWCTVATLFIMCQVHELQWSHWCDNREITLFPWLHIYYAYLAPVRFEQCVLWITYNHLCNIYIHRQVWKQITWCRCKTLHVIFPCLALGAWSIPQSTELRRTFECDPYWLRLLNCTAIV